MKTTKLWIKGHVFQILDILKALGILALVLMFMNFNIKLADSVQTAKNTATSTNKIVKSQNDILNAIKTLAEDNQRTSEQKTDIIICMLQVPIDQRTTRVVDGCRKQVDSGTFPSSAANSEAGGNTSSKANNQSGNQNPAVSSPNTTPNGNNSQPNNSPKKTDCTIDILFLHAGACK